MYTCTCVQFFFLITLVQGEFKLLEHLKGIENLPFKKSAYKCTHAQLCTVNIDNAFLLYILIVKKIWTE
jgi:hypothetical protein